ncbi:ShlB/FhaC/HecB family hemolysin secretion/activation protein [Spirulina major]|uniref:ShlB/FhaC/HecB family hemolysin secretion/activation protein n=1 Tax=Spirulina major TaxID=270636 RepID=UPI00093224BB|nr:ShlB/FhaC/HecB family hemolysin secretion/activation protein [Spirulina major]
MGSLLLSGLCPPSLLAQTPPPADLRPEQPAPPLPDVPDLPTETPPLLPGLDSTPPPSSTPPDVTRYRVDRIVVAGSTVFTAAEFEAVLATVPRLGAANTWSMVELQRAIAQITDLYVQQGYITTGAFLPPQTQYRADNRVIVIQVLEGRMTDIQVEVQGKLTADYVRSRLNLATTTPLQQSTIENALKLLQRDPNIGEVQANLAAGPEHGTNILRVVVTSRDQVGLSIQSDNQRSPSVGSDRQGATVRVQNLSGWGDVASLDYSRTAGSDSLNWSYTLPVSPHNTTLYTNGGIADSTIIESPFDRLDIQSQSHYLNLGLRHPLWQTPTDEFAVGLQLSHSHNQTTLLDIPFPLAPGADVEGRTRILALRLIQDWTTQGQTFVFALRSQFSLGLDALDATINSTAPDSRFLSWYGQAQWVKLLGTKRLIVRGEVQLSDRPLLSGEQFGLGGQNTIRGYRQNALLTDNGLLGMVELFVPIVQGGDRAWAVQLIPFINIGTGWNSGSSTQPQTQTLLSIGSGLQLSLFRQLTARLDWGVPLIHLEDTNATWQENGLYFQLQYNPF